MPSAFKNLTSGKEISFFKLVRTLNAVLFCVSVDLVRNILRKRNSKSKRELKANL